MLSRIREDIKRAADPEKAKNLQWFFKTGPGEYGEGDIFLGLTVPKSRAIAKKHKDLSLNDTEKLLHSKFHEERLIALVILVHKFKKGDTRTQKEVYDLYLKNTKHINTWDLVDLSAHKIVGAYLLDKDKKVLDKLTRSKDFWERRIVVIATFAFIKNMQFDYTLKISETLLDDKHDLIHKAVGWMLREIGNRSMPAEEKFLKKHYKKMPRTMLRYAIEKFPETRRQAYLKGTI